MNTAELLERERDHIVEAAVTAIRQTHLVHYERSGSDEVRRRVEILFDRLHEAVAHHDLHPMVEYASSLADTRFNAGFDLSEVQAAINAVEEAAWAAILASVPPEQLGESLGLVTTVLGEGKDALARTYVSLAIRTRAPAVDLTALFAGTNAG